jgi:hypothetical protein
VTQTGDVLCYSFYCCGDWCLEDDSMGSRSSLSITAMAKSRNTRNLSRWTASDSGEEVLVLVLVGRTEGVSTTLLLDSAASRMLLLKVVGLVRLLSEVFGVFDGDFMVFSEGGL